MKMGYCHWCQRNVGYKRAFGIGTLILVILTGGLWIIAMPFYPKRCIVCGNEFLFGVENK
jgi:hypothetical protein